MERYPNSPPQLIRAKKVEAGGVACTCRPVNRLLGAKIRNFPNGVGSNPPNGH